MIIQPLFSAVSLKDLDKQSFLNNLNNQLISHTLAPLMLQHPSSAMSDKYFEGRQADNHASLHVVGFENFQQQLAAEMESKQLIELLTRLHISYMHTILISEVTDCSCEP